MKQFVYGKSTYGDRSVDEYIASLSGTEQKAVRQAYDLARKLVPEAEQAVYYGMPCLKYKGKGLVSVMATKDHLSLYPFSNVEAVIAREDLAGYQTTKGSIHFTADHPLSDPLLRRIITNRRQNILEA